jgi:hypothetical protein
MSVEAEGRRGDFRRLYKQKEEQQVMELIEWILKDENLKAAIKAVKGNKGAAGIDKMPVEELDGYLRARRRDQSTDPCEAVQTAAGETGLHSEGQRKAKAIGNPDGRGQGDTAGGSAGFIARVREIFQ